MSLFRRAILGSNDDKINSSSSKVRRRKLAPVIDGLESRVVLSSASPTLPLNAHVIAITSAHHGGSNITYNATDTGGTYSSQPSPAT
jgi:hypothetical protein